MFQPIKGNIHGFETLMAIDAGPLTTEIYLIFYDFIITLAAKFPTYSTNIE